MPKNSVKAIGVTNIDSDTFTGAFQVINPTGLPESCFLLRIINGSNVQVGISYDATETQDILLPGETAQIPAQANSAPNNYVANFAKGTHVYVIGTAGDNSGDVYLAGYYQEKP